MPDSKYTFTEGGESMDYPSSFKPLALNTEA